MPVAARVGRAVTQARVVVEIVAVVAKLPAREAQDVVAARVRGAVGFARIAVQPVTVVAAFAANAAVDSITTIVVLAVIGALVVVDEVSIVAFLDTSVHNAILAHVQSAVGLAIIVVVCVLVVTGLGAGSFVPNDAVPAGGDGASVGAIVVVVRVFVVAFLVRTNKAVPALGILALIRAIVVVALVAVVAGFFQTCDPVAAIRQRAVVFARIRVVRVTVVTGFGVVAAVLGVRARIAIPTRGELAVVQALVEVAAVLVVAFFLPDPRVPVSTIGVDAVNARVVVVVVAVVVMRRSLTTLRT
jgi:hypothetical protein